VSAGGKTIWGDPSEVEKVVGGATFDVVLDNNGKDLDAVKYVNFLVFLLLIAFSYLFFFLLSMHTAISYCTVKNVANPTKVGGLIEKQLNTCIALLTAQSGVPTYIKSTANSNQTLRT
jgi:hypothetical protein